MTIKINFKSFRSFKVFHLMKFYKIISFEDLDLVVFLMRFWTHISKNIQTSDT